MVRTLLCAPVLLLALAGCSTYEATFRSAMASYRAGDAGATLAALDAAAAASAGGPAKPGRDELVWLLERGKVLQETGRFERSREDFVRADAIFDYYRRETPKDDFGAGVGAVLWDDTVTNYRGRLSDRILLRTHQAVNELASGDLESAQAYLRLAYQAQQDAVEQNRRAIENARSITRRRAPAGADLESLASGVLASDAYREATADVRTLVTPAYAAYTNPLTTYLSALTLYAAGDASNGRVELNRVDALVPGHPAIEADLAGDAWLDAERRGSRVVYVLFERGLIGYLAGENITIPQPWSGLSVITIPTMRFPRSLATGLEASTADGSTASPMVLADYNAIRAADLDREMPGVILRRLLSIALKEAATVVAAESIDDDDGWAQLGVLIAGSIWKATSSEIDSRGWRMLGADVGLARLEVTEPGPLDLTVIGETGQPMAAAAVEIPNGPATIVLVRSVEGRDLRATVIPLVAHPDDGPDTLARRTGETPAYDSRTTDSRRAIPEVTR